MDAPPRLSRRRLLQLAGALPVGALLAACGGSPPAPLDAIVGEEATSEPTVTPTPEPPFVVAAGEQERLLMAGTPQETPLYVFGSGYPGPILAVLGGVHGNEPGGWLAADELLDAFRPTAGAFLIVPRANRLATQQFVRTTNDMGDLNRLYPGDPNGLPMARMAHEIVQALREFRATVVIDMHESWSFYTDRTDTQTGTAFLGQTVSSSTQQGLALGREVVDAVNQRVRADHETLILRDFPPPNFVFPTATPGGPPEPTLTAASSSTGGGRSRSSLGLSTHIPGSIALLVEMGQQQQLARRIAIHVDVVNEVARRIGITRAS
ncbi:MAG TPA: succinylglutamate desuccinylase/aspartoacylase family protein [Dehalococcoidia bacterium]|nr:succinylglutamate desuccinylase/aspartoacylase family protein [Dehalococcoidia bacterium]